MEKRLDYIDIAKGICILLVVIGHILQFNLCGTASDTVFDFIYCFHMPVFMLLSGYIASLSRDKIDRHNVGVYIKKKFYSLVIPFFVWGLIVMPFIVSRQPLRDFCDVFLTLLSNPSIGAWFIIVLFCIQIYYLCFCLLSNVYKKTTWMNESIACCMVIGILAYLTTMMENIAVLGGVKIYLSVRYVLSFFVGYFFQRYLQKMVFNNIVLLISIIIFAIFIKKFSFGATPLYIQLLLSFCASIIILNLSKVIANYNQGRTSEYLIKFGKNSLVIYLTHYPIITFFQTDYKWNTDDIHAIPLFLLSILLAVPVAMLCEQWGKLISENKTLNFLLYGRIKKG